MYTPSPMNAPAAPVASGSTASADAAIAAWGGLDERAAGEALVVDVAGFEGPLDLLLALARTQKVDLHKISVLALADQYLEMLHGGLLN